MLTQEGVIKYQLEYSRQAIGHRFPISEINAWRTILVRLGLIGQSPERYDNIGFGNISQRVAGHNDQFIISGTQTGHLETLSSEHFCLIVHAEPSNNRLQAKGLSKPSSESLTHACVYQQNQSIQSVIHAHCPEIWRHTKALDLPHTDATIAYGTVEMAIAVEQLFVSSQLIDQSLFTMLGHEDGVIAFGNTMREAALILIDYVSKAIDIELCHINR